MHSKVFLNEIKLEVATYNYELLQVKLLQEVAT